MSLFIKAQNEMSLEKELNINKIINGTLLLPENNNSDNLVIIISDYGPTDRNGNQNFQKSNILKKLAASLSENNIASYRYDKRSSIQVQSKNKDKNIDFDDFVTDAKAVIDYFKTNNTFKKVYIIGHGQGSLVGLLASEKADGFISLSATGDNIGDFIVDQINNTARQFIDDTKRVVEKLKKGKTTTEYRRELSNMFHIDTQPFMISWMKYTPKDIIKTLDMPALIINGTKDLEVNVEDSERFAKSNPKAELKLIPNMNHAFYTIEGDRLENVKSYNESFRKINPELIDAIVSFISKKD